MATIEQQLNALSGLKNQLAEILVSKGVEASNEETFTTLVPKVDQLTLYQASWHTLATNISLSNTNNTATVNGLKANTLTRVTFSGSITSNYLSKTYSINKRTNEESANGVYTGSGTDTHPDAGGGSVSYGFTLTMGDGQVTFSPHCSGYAYDECGSSASVSLSRASMTITKIEQYY